MKTAAFAGLLLASLAATGMAQKGAIPSNEPPADLRAPKGMCRIWLKGVPAAQQPAPTDCAAAVKNCPPTGRVLFGESDGSKAKPKADSVAASESRKRSPLIKSLVDQKKPKPPTTSAVPPKPPDSDGS